MNSIQIFKNEAFGEVRVTEVNGQPYFIASDVAKALGYQRPNDAISQHVDKEDTVKYRISDNQGVPHNYLLITESGVYALAFGSKLETAKVFKRWVTSEVLPAIRKTGGYIPVNEGESEADIMAKALLIAQRQIEAQRVRAEYEAARAEALQKRTEKMQGQIDYINEKQKKLLPAATFAKAVETSDSSVLVGELAKLICQNGVPIGQNRLFDWLRQNGYLCSKGKCYNLPTQKSMDAGLMEIKKTSIVKPTGVTIVTSTPKITGKGQIYFVNKFLIAAQQHKTK